MSKETIYREDAIKALHKRFSSGFDCDRWWNSTTVLFALNSVPSADIPRGEWVEHKNAEEICGTLISNYECPLCHEWQTLISNFCPSCGARMRGTGDEAN